MRTELVRVTWTTSLDMCNVEPLNSIGADCEMNALSCSVAEIDAARRRPGFMQAVLENRAINRARKLPCEVATPAAADATDNGGMLSVVSHFVADSDNCKLSLSDHHVRI